MVNFADKDEPAQRLAKFVAAWYKHCHLRGWLRPAMENLSSDMNTTTISTRVTDPPLELHVCEKAFLPNPTTVRFARAIGIHQGDVVLDIGTGVGPLAIMAAMGGAGRVIAVDPVAMHCELTRMNVAKYGLEDKVHVYQGCFFDPIESEPELEDLKANVIIGDVSGIADSVAHALGWYSDEVPTGGPDGTEVIIDLLRRSSRYLAPGGSIYFPIAVDLSDGQKIINAAHELFADVVNALQKEYVQFPLTDQQVRDIDDAYGGNIPDFITVQQGKRSYWRGQIWKLMNPV